MFVFDSEGVKRNLAELIDSLNTDTHFKIEIISQDDEVRTSVKVRLKDNPNYSKELEIESGIIGDEFIEHSFCNCSEMEVDFDEEELTKEMMFFFSDVLKEMDENEKE